MPRNLKTAATGGKAALPQLSTMSASCCSADSRSLFKRNASKLHNFPMCAISTPWLS
jgi:hypothetical protein